MKTLFFLILTAFTSYCQKGNDTQVHQDSLSILKPVPYSHLSESVDESSGLEIIDDHLFTINDSGGASAIYFLNKEGKEERKLDLKGVKNHDWEEVAAYGDKIYVGDFGNNRGNRKNLSVYVVNEWQGDEADHTKISFRYKSQSDFSVRTHNHSNDCEAMIAFDNELILFSKDWLDQTTEVYHIPIDAEGEQEIEATEKMDMGLLITGADYDHESQKLVLCGYMNFEMYLWVFDGALPSKMLTDMNQKYKLEGLTGAQVEGITFIDENSVMISTEKTRVFDQQLWTVKLP